MKHTLLLIKYISLVVIMCFSVLSGYSQQQPNIIFIMADDLGYETLGCYGNDINKTPHLDHLAEQGMLFTQAYANPLCTPTRVQVMTGKYNFRNYTGFGLLDKKETTFADLLKQAGYKTAVVGKWQLLGNKFQRKLAGGKEGSYPEEAGFDEYCLWQVDTLGSRYKNPVITTKTGTQVYPGKYAPDIFSDYALQFMEDNREHPFFLYYPMALTHDPFQPTPDSPGFDEFKVQSKANNPIYFKDMVEYMDKLIGRISAKVDELGISKNTLIIFIGDNGTSRKIESSYKGKKVTGGKGRTTESGTHVPMITYWKGRILPGQINENLIDLTDFLPTFMEASNTPLPNEYICDGVSFYGQLFGQKDASHREWVFCHYNPRWKNDVNETWVHNKNWKLYKDGRMYNIKNDPQEENPISEEEMTNEMADIKKTFAKVISGLMD